MEARQYARDDREMAEREIRFLKDQLSELWEKINEDKGARKEYYELQSHLIDRTEYYRSIGII